jgi:hypothetical protein
VLVRPDDPQLMMNRLRGFGLSLGQQDLDPAERVDGHIRDGCFEPADLRRDGSGLERRSWVGGLVLFGHQFRRHHLVAVPFDQIKFVNEPVSATSASSTSDTSDRPMSSTTTGAATTNTVPTGSAPAMKANSNAWYPDHAVFNATKDELKAMPEFKYST